MNVGIVVTNFYPRLGGMEYATYFLAEKFAEREDVSIFVATSAMPEVPRDFPYPFPVYRHRSLSVLTPYLRRKSIGRMIRKNDLDLLHGKVLTGGGHEAALASRKYGVPCIGHSSGSDVQVVEEIGYGELRNPAQRVAIRETMEAVEKIVAVSSVNRDLIIDLGADPEKVTVIPNGCHCREIERIPFQDVRSELEIGEDTFVLVTVGRNSPVKRMELLFQALKLLKKSEHDILCLCIGPETNLRNLAETYEVEEMVRIIGPVVPKPGKDDHPLPRMINLLRCADVYASCSYMESFNNSALDALASGTPVLVTPKQGIVDHIESGKTGFVIEEETPAYLAERLESLSRQRRQLRADSEYISKSVAHLDWSSVAAGFAEFYATILQRASG